MSSYYAEAVTPRSSPQFRSAGSGRFLDAYAGAKAKEAEFLTSAIDAKYNKKIAYKTAQGPSVEPRSFDFGALAKGAAGLASGLAGAFKPQTAAGEATDSSVNLDPYKLDFSGLDLTRTFGGNYPSSWSSTAGFDLSGSASSFDTSAFTYSNPIGGFDFGLGNNFSSTTFGS